jgi:curli biogenesis system outer membrane secretion channel CsgG
MLGHLLVAGMLLQATSPSPTTAPASSTTTASQATAKVEAASKDEGSDLSALLKVNRIYVDSFGDDVVSRELQSMIVSAIVASKRFRVTENRDKADAILKGVALEKSTQELHAYGEGTSVGVASGGSHSDSSGASGGFAARQMGISDSSVNTETIDEARIAVRLVNLDGDVIWTSAQESKGAKYKGSSADVADKCVKQLLRDVEKLESSSGASTPTATVSSSGPNRQ